MANKIPGTNIYKVTLYVSAPDNNRGCPVTDEYEMRDLIDASDEYHVIASEIETLGVYTLGSPERKNP